MTCGKPRVMQRSYLSRSSGPAKLMPSGVRIAATAPRRRASSLRYGIRPSGGSITTDVRREGLPRSSQWFGGPVPAAPWPAARGAMNSSRSASSARSAWVTRCENSSAVTVSRVPNCGGRSNGTPSSSSVVNRPEMSGSPHGVRGALNAVCAVISAPMTTTNAAIRAFGIGGRIPAVILQRPMTFGDKLALLRRRLARFGLARVVNELLFQVYYRLFLRSGDDQLRATLGLNGTVTRESLAKTIEVFDVDSINAPASQALLARLAPDLVVMASRELVRPDVLKLARIGFIGCHPGILPDFRGAYASFWAMHEGRADRIGLSVYLA